MRCGKMGCANKELSCALKVRAKAISKGEAVDQQKLAKCVDKFDGGGVSVRRP